MDRNFDLQKEVKANPEQLLKTGFRYIVQIKFKGDNSIFFALWDIYEPIKTLREAQSYKNMIDETVKSARVVDLVKDCVTEQWV